MNSTQRIVIIGNSGSGKSHLAKLLSKLHPFPVIHLDELFWTPGGFNKKRPKAEVRNEIEQKREEERWIAEGVFGELAELFLPRADALIHLDMDWPTCQRSLLSRGSESSRQLNPKDAEDNFQKLLAWARQYWERTDLRSHAGHLRLFSIFVGQKFTFTSRAEVNEFLEQQKRQITGVY
jgi:adenylate kinase family enzyme